MLLEHNVETYEQFEDMLLETHECCLIADPSIGKSNISMEFIDRYKLNTLVVCPTNALCNEWKANSEKYNVADISAITYASFSKSFMVLNNYDCYVFDEAHHAGSKKWGAAVKKFKETTDAFVIGLTATNVRYSDGIDVAMTVFNENVVYGLKYHNAIEMGILPRAEYICSVFDQDTIYQKYKNMNLSDELIGRLELSLKNSMKISECLIKHFPENPKGIVFVDRISSIDKTIDLINGIFPDLPLFSISSAMDKKHNMKVLNMFKKAKTGLIINVGMLGEGIHPQGINTVIMLRKTCSSTVYIQQLGRGLNIGSTGVKIFDFVGNNMSVSSSNIGSIVSDYDRKKSTINEIEKFSNQFISYNYAKDIIDVLRDIDTCPYTLWTEEEDDIIRKYYHTMGSKIVDMLPGRTKPSIIARANYIGICFTGKWAEEEDDIIRKYYPTMGYKVIDMLPGRTKSSIIARACKLNIKSNLNSWTEEEDDILRKYYPTIGTKVIDRLPGRTKWSIVARASHLNIKSNSSYKPWTEEEDDIIRKYYPTMGYSVISMLPGRTKESVINKAGKLNIKSNPKSWTEEEDDIIRKYYPTMGYSVISMLPGRAKGSIIARASKLNIKSNPKSWTEEEDDIIRKYYPTMGYKVIDMLPGRTKMSIAARASHLNIKSNSSYKPWTKEEDDILRKYYPTIGTKVIDRLPGRTKGSIIARAGYIGVSFK